MNTDALDPYYGEIPFPLTVNGQVADLHTLKPRGCCATKIEWADHTANPIRVYDAETKKVGWGCRKISPGCLNCYAETLNGRWGTGAPYTVEGQANQIPFLDRGVLLRLLKFKPRGPFKQPSGRPIVFLGDMNDLFYGNEMDRKACEAVGAEFRPVPFEWIDEIVSVAYLRPDIDFIILTKRPDRMLEYFSSNREREKALHRWAREAGREFAVYTTGYRLDRPWGQTEARWPIPNLWLMTSVENQRQADLRLPFLVSCPAAILGVSIEPLIESVDLSPWMNPTHLGDCSGCTGPRRDVTHQGGTNQHPSRTIDWAIVGGESGPGSRPFNDEWARSIRDQCTPHGVAYFAKQMGTNPVGVSGPINLKDRKGGDMSEWTDDLRIREFPRCR